MPHSPRKQDLKRSEWSKFLTSCHRLVGLVDTYARPQWRQLLLLVLLNFAIIAATTLLTIMTAATLNILTLPADQLGNRPGQGAFNLNQIGNWAYKLSDFAHLHGRFQLVVAIGSAALLIGILKSFISYAAAVTGSWTATRMAQNMQRDLFSHVLHFSMAFFNRHRTSELMSRIQGDSASAMQEFSRILNTFLVSPLLLLFYVILIIRTSWLLLGGIVLAGVVHHLISAVLSKPIRRPAHRLIDASGQATNVLHETLVNIRVVKSFAAEEVEQNRFLDRLKRFHREVFLGAALEHAQSPARLIVNQTVQFVILIVAAYEYGQGRIPLSTCLLFVFICRSIVDPINQISEAYVQSGKMLATLSRVFNLLHTPVDMIDGTRSVPELRSSIVLDKVHFSYEGNPVIRNINLEIRKGEMLALVGPSGGGKSTLVDLILRFYDPQEGRILLDGTDIRELRLQGYRKLFGIVSQEPLLFHTSLRENILYGRPDLGDEDMRRAARIAYAETFIEAMPKGYDTVVGDRGLRLSGGQRQRIAIARAVVNRPHVLILDEATSALDSESEREVQRAITDISRMGTSIVIAHRLSTILHADRIAFIQGGAIQQIGRHEELLESSPAYRRLCEIQFRQGNEAEAR